MTLAQFVQLRRERWEQLNALLQRIETRKLQSLSRAELKRLGQLYRSLTSDLAQSQTNFPQSDVAQALNQLASRAHPHVHRSRSLTGRSAWEFFRADLPSNVPAEPSRVQSGGADFPGKHGARGHSDSG